MTTRWQTRIRTRRFPLYGAGFALLLSAAIIAPSAIAQQDQNTQPRLSISGVPILLPAEEDLADITIDPSLRRYVRELAADDYFAREEASESLMAMRPPIDQLCALLSEDTLTHEQRHRLLAVLQHRIITVPRAARASTLGVLAHVDP